ncbi:hypothetical protein L596_029565 [Steinernema carpocapsae]|uniref:Neogenin C-terminal domain-containing protein n=1 Tax=Steinernema carpocapsae TaxID=34508 RepID=A0A4U5LV10_STECR|nr:hypothetical protein L596_029565 [Steinernema carpocapsae]
MRAAIHGPHSSDVIYSTPYSGTPLPSYGIPPPPGASRPVTPASTHRMRIQPMSSTPSPQQKTSVNVHPVRSGSIPTRRAQSVLEDSPPVAPPHAVARSVDNVSIPRSTYTEPDLSFLDPRRKLETQTKEDFIY